MKKLILVRHAKSEGESDEQTDFERPLNSRGRKAAKLMGERLAEKKEIPQLIVSSPAKRARQTAKRLAKKLEYAPDSILFREDIYEASCAELVKLLHSLDDAHSEVLLVGHNPGFSELGQWLCAEAPEWLQTCALLILELPVKQWRDIAPGSAKQLCYDYPKKKEE